MSATIAPTPGADSGWLQDPALLDRLVMEKLERRLRQSALRAGSGSRSRPILGRVTKGRIVQALREAKGESAAERVRSLKKAEMAKAAEDLLIGTGWLPEPLRTPGQTFGPGIEPTSLADAEAEAQSAEDGEPAMDEPGSGDEASDPSAPAAAVAAE